MAGWSRCPGAPEIHRGQKHFFYNAGRRDIWGGKVRSDPVNYSYKRENRSFIFKEMEELAMKGFNTGDGYMGMVDGEYILFASEADYYDYVND